MKLAEAVAGFISRSAEDFSPIVAFAQAFDSICDASVVSLCQNISARCIYCAGELCYNLSRFYILLSQLVLALDFLAGRCPNNV